MTESEANLREFRHRLAVEAPDARVVLFGSHARDTATPRSDIDLLVIEPEVENTALESVRLRRALRNLRLPVEVVVISEHEAAELRDVHGSLAHAALSEGHEFPFTHDIAVPTQLCDDASLGLPTTLGTIDLLTPYGVAWAQAIVDRPPG